MAATRLISWPISGANLYGVRRDRVTGQMWDNRPVELGGQVLVEYNPANWAHYRIGLTETPEDGCVWPFPTPAALPGSASAPRSYDLEVYQQETGDALLTDGPPIYREAVWWNGEDLMSEAEYTAWVVQVAFLGGTGDGVSQPSPGAV